MSDDRFYSIDRLVEFGMSMAVAQQMMQTMNHAMQNLRTQDFQSALQPSSAAAFYVMIDNKPAGPFTEQELSVLVKDNKIDQQTFVWKAGLPGWLMAEQMPEVLKLILLKSVNP